MTSVSIVVEWYNLTHASPNRAKRLLADLSQQAIPLYSSNAHETSCLTKPLDVVIVYDDDKRSAQEVRSVLGLQANEEDVLKVRLLPVLNADYCKMKNAGAAAADGEIVIFMDSDVSPEPNWLAAYMDALADGSRSVVVGNTYTDHNTPGVYAKSMALTWMFPLRDSSDLITPSTWFYAPTMWRFGGRYSCGHHSRMPPT